MPARYKNLFLESASRNYRTILAETGSYRDFRGTHSIISSQRHNRNTLLTKGCHAENVILLISARESVVEEYRQQEFCIYWSEAVLEELGQCTC